MRIFRRWLPLVVLILLTSGCSLARFGYALFPTWAMWELDSYLSMDTGQRLMARNAIDELKSWHQRSELPKYAAFLREVDARILTLDSTSSSLGPQDVQQWRDRIQAAWPPIADHLTPAVTRLLASLTPDQVEHLKGKLADANEDALDKYKPDQGAVTVTARVDRWKERAEFFLGSLSGGQRQSLKDAAAAMPPSEAPMLAERRLRQQELLGLIGRLRGLGEAVNGAERTRAEGWTRDYLLSLVGSHGERVRPVMLQAQQASDALTVRILDDASAAQRKHLSERLLGFASDFEQRAQAARKAEAAREGQAASG